MVVDVPKRDTSLLLAKVRHETPVPPVLQVSTGQITGLSSEGATAAGSTGDNADLLISVALRDRSYVQEVYTDRAQTVSDASGVLCVGDKCSMAVEEPQVYAQNSTEHRKRYIPGEFTEARDEKDPLKLPGRGKGPWAAPLREPASSYELISSGLDQIPEENQKFKVKAIPDFCENIIPHRYILPKNEVAFKMQKKAGVYPRIMNLISKDTKQVADGGKKSEGADPKKKIMIDRLTHLMKDVVVTLLALYPDKTCDVELQPSFMQSWKDNEQRQYSMPGNLRIHNFPNGTSRYILKRVPMFQVRPVHAAGINVYDAGFGSTDAAADIDPSMYTHSFNPIASSMPTLAQQTQKTVGGSSTEKEEQDTRGGYSMIAGPVPPDANPAVCQYEWLLHVRAPSDNDMYQFVQALRSVIRVQQHNQAHRVKQAANEKANAASRAASPPRRNLNAEQQAPHGGQLEVVLVEARHLLKPKIQKGAGAFDALLGGAKIEDEVQNMVPETLNPFVNFRFLKNGEPLAYKGSKVQKSPSVTDSRSPSWGKMPELQSAGGWTFRTTPIDPDRVEFGKIPFFEIEFEVRHQGMGRNSLLLGSQRLPVTEAKLLCDPKAPFQNLWLPLQTTDDDGSEKMNQIGEIHIMTRWVPNNKMLLEVDLPSARAYMDRELRAIALGSVMREPLYSTMARMKPYNPNLQIAEGASRPQERWKTIVTDIEEITHGASYIDCCEKRLAMHWMDFGRELEKQNRHKTRIGEVRLLWLDEKEESKVAELTDLFHRGVPGMMRSTIWKDITLASRVEDGHAKGPDKNGEEDFKALVDYMGNMLTETMEQLNEDFANAALWETSKVPEVVDLHYERLLKAREVCVALIAFSLNPSQPGKEGNKPASNKAPPPNYTQEKETGSSSATAVAYSNSLLVLAYYLLLPQTRLQAAGEQKGMAGSDAFWLLYSLIGSPINASYHSYYGTPKQWVRNVEKDQKDAGFIAAGTGNRPQIRKRREPIACTSGAMEDVFLFECCLVTHEKELWVKLNTLGFQFQSVFYQIFMQLYAQFLPTSALFRFWDVLLFESTNPAAFPHPRHSLIDLAFGVVKSQAQVLMNCESAVEARDCIIGALASQHDMQAMIHMIQEAEGFLWGGWSKNSIVKLWRSGIDAYDEFYNQYDDQNSILKALCHDDKLGDLPKVKLQSGSPGLRTDLLLSHVVKILQDAFGKDSGPGEFSGVIRPVPNKIMEFGPPIDESVASSTATFFTNLFNTHAKALVGETAGFAEGAAMYPVAVIPNTRPEPTKLAREDWLSRIVTEIPNWTNNANEVFEVFCDKIRKRMSLNELIGSLIICSKGTAGLKALGLFNLFANVVPDTRFLDKGSIRHCTPVSMIAQNLVSQREKGGFTDTIRASAPPEQIDPSKTALHFQIYGNFPKADTLLGEVVMSSLTPFISTAAFPPEVISYPIWGPPQKVTDVVQDLNKTGEGGHEKEGAMKRLSIGEIRMGLKWIPGQGNAQNPSEDAGQLMIIIKSIKFEPTRVPNEKYQNPSIKVLTYDGQRNAKKISRWDPRTTSTKVTTLGRGPYGGFIEFEKTMMQPTQHMLTHFPGLADMGHVYQTEQRGNISLEIGEWQWNDTWGKQLSVPNFTMLKEFLQMPKNSNVIHLKAVRLATHMILTRSLHHVTNRQAFLLADGTFSRSGAVPAILDAFLGPGPSMPPLKEGQGVSALRAEMISSGWLNVGRQLLLEWDRQVANNSGSVDLWKEWPAGGVNLSTLRIRDPFAGKSKVLWIRFARAGDGERGSVTIQVDADGNLQKPSGSGPAVPIDMEGPTMLITKEEFITCMLGSPLLGESLRRMTSADHDTMEAKSISLDVTIEDPAGQVETGHDDLLDLMNVGRTVLLEVWDSSLLGKNVKGDLFLGEAELPALSSLSAQPRDIALPLRGGDDSLRKDTGKTASREITGVLYCQVAWQMPAEMVKDVEDDEDLALRAKRQEAMHTGKLTLKIKSAENLRQVKGTVTRSKDPTPYVKVHVRNDETLKWDKSTVTGIDEPIFKTKPKTSSRNPTFDEEFSKLIQTGGYEARFEKLGVGAKMAKGIQQTFSTQKQKEDYQRAQELKALGGTEDNSVKLLFGPDQYDQANPDKTGPGRNHKVPVYLHDTILDFKAKVIKAAHTEAQVLKKQSAQQNADTINQLEGCDVGNRHLVLVFVAPEKLRQMAQQRDQVQSAAYSRTYKLAIKDPSNWQPLEPLLTFNAYSKAFGFGSGSHVPLLRIVKNTPQYLLQNNRVRQFQEEHRRLTELVEVIDTDRQCYANCMYTHRHDANSIEWRPAIVSPAEDGAGGVRQFRVNWITTPKWQDASGSAGQAAQAPDGDLLPEEKIMLAPRVPKCVGGIAHPEHKVYLDQAPGLKAQGMNVQKIVTVLNEQLERNEKEAGGAGESKAKTPPITFAEVQRHLENADVAKAAGSLEPSKPASSTAASASQAASRSTPAGKASAPLPPPGASGVN
eukprot:gnl/MRDRNA2_/MRDRNA2_30116_c0_seq1.p1 gnl/MRDRNA2_/MRDRNA2_30116_c0~~gnl/MRDRNA2_/MRDRNA2_30116_c0_seq1.p1  ORF type:complete len:2643 (+),score=515.69 gnl/MRDRNA2_/MRDRNA2_30116_c0_seq1:515-7930(+)